MNNALQLDNVSFRYSSRTPWILRQASLTIPYGGRFSLCGDNGIGKSTIVKLLLGYETPDSGQVLIFGQTVSRSDHLPSVGLIGEISSDDDAGSLPNNLTVGRLLAAYHELTPSFSPAECASLLHNLRMETTEFQSKRIGQLSRGERQRLTAYLALAKGPALILADEPFEGLDPASRALLADSIDKYLAQWNSALLWISHRKEECFRIARSHFRMVDGVVTPIPPPAFDFRIRCGNVVVVRTQETAEVVLADLARQLGAGGIESAELHALLPRTA